VCSYWYVPICLGLFPQNTRNPKYDGVSSFVVLKWALHRTVLQKSDANSTYRYLATTNKEANENYLGPAPLEEMAK
jgi:hypothetical protein